MSLSNEFWLGTALAIPLGVAASALSFFIEPLLNAISKNFALSWNKLKLSEYRKIKQFVENPIIMNGYMLSLILKAFLIVPIQQLWSGTRGTINSYARSYAPDGSGNLDTIMWAIDQIITIGSAVVVIAFVRRGVIVYSQVANFPEYERKVIAKIGSIPPADNQPMLGTSGTENNGSDK